MKPLSLKVPEDYTIETIKYIYNYNDKFIDIA